MRILSLFLKNFRNYEEVFIPFSEGINLITGDNGEGKTNLLEALYFFVTGRSFRTNRLSELIQFGKPHFYLELTFLKNGIEQTLKIYADSEQRKILHNFTPLPNLSALFGILLGVLLTPTDHELILGLPSRRRQFLDLHIAQTNPLYVHHLSRYLRALKQRNILLRQQEKKKIEIWEETMMVSADFVKKEREKAILDLSEEANHFQSYLSEKKDHLQLKYRQSSLCFKQRLREFDLGYTLSGPHRDDLSLFVGEKEAKTFASVGQIRTTALSLRLSEWERFKKFGDDMPLFFLDEIGMGLDKEREDRLYSYIERLISEKSCQVFLTSPRPLSKNLPCHTIRIHNGSLF